MRTVVCMKCGQVWNVSRYAKIGRGTYLCPKCRKNKRKDGIGMAVKQAKTIAEYAIRKWLEDEKFVLECFQVEFQGHEAVVTDGNGDKLRLIYDPNTRMVVCADL